MSAPVASTSAGASSTIQQRTRPATFTLASVDLNVLLTGKIIGDGVLKTGAEFELAPDGLYVAHPALVRIAKSSTSQTLRSLNTNAPIFSLPTPAHPDSSSQSPTPAPTIISLHLPLLTFEQAQPLRQSPLYSATFNVILDGDGFQPPRFDPAKAPGTPALGAQGSPTIPRAVLSPLLSPQRRTSAAGNNGSSASASETASLPPLSRGRSGSLGGKQREPSASPAQPTGLEALLPSSATAPTLSAVALDEISSDSKRAADEIMTIRRAHEVHARKVKAEQELLEARAAYVAGLPMQQQSDGSAVVVHGFGNEPPTLPASGSGSAGTSPSAGRGTSAERSRSPLGQSAATPTEISRGRSANPGREEQISKKITADDEDEDRGRSRSRQRAGRQSSRSKSRSAQAVAAAVADVVAGRERSPLPPLPPSSSTSGSSTPANLMRSPREKPKAGDSISATLAEEDEEDESGPVATLIPEETKGTNGNAGYESGPRSFVPSSHVLLSVPEEEEEDRPQGGSPRGESQQLQGRDRNEREDEPPSPEHEDPFEMDEDLDVEDLHLPSAVDSAPVPEVDQAPTSPAVKPTNLSSSSQNFRPGSISRPFNLSSSYAGLLASSMAANKPRPSKAQDSPSYGFKSPPVSAASFQSPPTSSSFAPGASTDSRGEPVSGSPDDDHPGDESTPAQDAALALAFRPKPDPSVTQESARQIRDLQALDAPSHRIPVPRRVSSQRSNGGTAAGPEPASSQVELDEEEEALADVLPEDVKSPLPKEFAVGSVPISIGGFARRAASNFVPGGEDAKGKQGTAEPDFAKSYIPEGFSAGGKKKSQDAEGAVQAEAVPAASSLIGQRVSPQPARANGAPVASSLAQSLANNPQGGFAHRLQQERAKRGQDAEEESDEDDGDEDAPDRETGFLPPHQWSQAARKEEELLSRSINRY